jgi:hypothetical protein
MSTKKLSHYALMQLWKKGFDADRGYFVGKTNETPLMCAQEMGLKNIKTIDIAGSIVGKNKENKKIVIAWVTVPYAVDITDELKWSDDF